MAVVPELLWRVGGIGHPTFQLPNGLTVLNDGSIAVCNSNLHQVVLLDPDDGSVRRTVDGFNLPCGIAATADGGFVVANYGSNTIVKLNRESGFERQLVGGLVGRLNLVADIAVLLDGRIVVCMSKNAQVFSSEGEALGGEALGLNDGWLGPCGVAALPDGNCVVCQGARLKVLTPELELVRIIQEDFFESPWGVTVLENETLLVSDQLANELFQVTVEGELVTRINEIQDKTGRTRLEDPTGLAVLPGGRVIVVERSANRVSCISLQMDSTLVKAAGR